MDLELGVGSDIGIFNEMEKLTERKKVLFNFSWRFFPLGIG